MRSPPPALRNKGLIPDCGAGLALVAAVRNESYIKLASEAT